MQAAREREAAESLRRRVDLLERTLVEQDAAQAVLQARLDDCQRQRDSFEQESRAKDEALRATENELAAVRANLHAATERLNAARASPMHAQLAPSSLPVTSVNKPTVTPTHKQQKQQKQQQSDVLALKELQMRVLELGELNAKLLRENMDLQEVASALPSRRMSDHEPVLSLRQEGLLPQHFAVAVQNAAPMDARPAKPAPAEVRIDEDVYWHHFYLLVMGEKSRSASLSLDLAALDRLNRVDAGVIRGWYARACEQGVPPEDWLTFVRMEIAPLLGSPVRGGGGLGSRSAEDAVAATVQSFVERVSEMLRSNSGGGAAGSPSPQLASALREETNTPPSNNSQRRRRLGSIVATPALSPV